MPYTIPTRQKTKYRRLRQTYSRAEAARMAGFSVDTAKRIDKDHAKRSGDECLEDKLEVYDDGPIPLDKLKAAAKESLSDIALFGERYCGLKIMPFQQEAASKVLELLATPGEEYLVINMAPGTGKSTFWSFVLPAWVTCRQRAIRGMIGSAAHTSAVTYTGRLRTLLTRQQTVKAKQRDIDAGIACDAVATLVEDFGRFQPEKGDDIWREGAFSVAQFDAVEISEKERTWQAFGRTSTFIGFRVDLAIWDDAYDPSQIRTAEARADLETWWSDIAETRLEPGGLLILQGQRLGSDDLYAYALGQKGVTELDEEDTGTKYHHIKFKAHYDDRCHEDHGPNAKPYPEGCLLYPKRLGWKKLQMLKANNPRNFEVLYQQEDTDAAGTLVNKLWVSGGKGSDGVDYPGCWDKDRSLMELPKGLSTPFLSVATADPSPTKFWAIQHWIYHPASEQRFLMDTVRQAMDAPDFLDWLDNLGSWTGLMLDWQVRSREKGFPISHWIIERNAAQRFLLQYDHVRRFCAKYSTHIVPHDTARNKLDPDFGVQMLANRWRYGQVRLPGKQRDGSRIASLKLVDEVTRYPEARTDDQVMAEWFFEYHLENLKISLKDRAPQAKRPPWARGWRQSA